MKKIFLSSRAFLLAGILFLTCIGTGCRDEDMLKPDKDDGIPFKAGYKLSYVQREVSSTKGVGDSELIFVGGSNHQVAVNDVEIHFDANKKNYQISTTRRDTKDKTYKDFDEPSVKRTVRTNFETTFYDRSGRISSMIPNSGKEEDDYTFLLMTYPERSKLIQEKLYEGNSKSGDFIVEVLNDRSVKVIREFNLANEIDEDLQGCTAVSYINTFYGVPVISELYDKEMKLMGKVTILYQLIDEIPVVAYEEMKSYTTNSQGEIEEHTTIISYEDINISNY